MSKQKVYSKAFSFEKFDLKQFMLSFQRPFIILMVFLVGLATQVPGMEQFVAILGGGAVIAERLWALAKFYITEYIE